jgi:hypothetical protein
MFWPPYQAFRFAVLRRGQVATWELVAALVGLHAVMQGQSDLEAPVRLGRHPASLRAFAFYPQVICFIDSNVALGTLLRGSSRLGWRAVAVPRAHLSCAGNPIGTG